MPGASHHEQLQVLLRHPSLWRGRGAVEVLVAGTGHGELTLWAPLLRQLTGHETARCCAFVAPPFELFAPAWRAAGMRLDRLLVARTGQPLWALEQSLLAGACAIGFGWLDAGANLVMLRRLALAAEQGGALGVLIRPPRVAHEATAAVLRLAVTRNPHGLSVDLLKGRGLVPRRIELGLP